MRLPIVLTAIPLLLAGAAPALADDTQAWGTLNVQAQLGGPWRIQNEAVLRTSDARGLYEIENSTLVGYKFDKTFTYWIGYTHNPLYLQGHNTGMEHRIRQQLAIDNFAKLGPVRFSGRVRMETRWRDNTPGTAWRLRPYLKASLPIHGKTALNFTTEEFIDLGTTTFQRINGFERSRSGITISTPLSKQIGLEVGYLNQHGFIRRAPDSNDHAVTVALSASF